MIYLEIFLSYLQIGFFSIGGGYAALPMVSSIVLDQRGWLSLQEFADMVTLSVMSPGTVAVNTATFVGFKLGGVFGAIVAVVGCMLPAFVIIILLSYLLERYSHLVFIDGIMGGIRPAVTGLIASAALSILFLSLFHTKTVHTIRSVDIVAVMIAVLSFFFARQRKTNPVLIILGAGVIGMVLYYLQTALFVA